MDFLDSMDKVLIFNDLGSYFWYLKSGFLLMRPNHTTVHLEKVVGLGVPDWASPTGRPRLGVPTNEETWRPLRKLSAFAVVLFHLLLFSYFFYEVRKRPNLLLRSGLLFSDS